MVLAGVIVLVLLTGLLLTSSPKGEQTSEQASMPDVEIEIDRMEVALKELEMESVDPAPDVPLQDRDEQSQPDSAKPEPNVATASTASSAHPTPQGQSLHISANYRKNLGFAQYAKAMEAIGGCFYVYDGDKIRAELDVLTAQLREVDRSKLQAMSPRVREITDIALDGCLAQAHAKLGPGYYDIILLIPSDSDAAIQAAAHEELTKRGITSAQVARIEADYRLQAGRLELLVTRAWMQDGTAVALAKAVALDSPGGHETTP